jgi:lysophospholipase L1-like esterase
MMNFVVNVQAQGIPSQARRIVFLGDSITHSGGYVVALEAAWLQTGTDRSIEFLNLGLPSETVSGLSEPGHAGGKFPRPDLHERLTRVLDQTKPDLVVACYGMNDGIYYPLSEDRFEKFKDGILKLHRAVEATGASIVHLTPAFFDALPIRPRLLPAGLSEYRQPYEGYDDVLEAYSQWLLSKRGDGWVVVDVHSAMKNAVLQARQSDPEFTFAKDGVHPNAAGETVMAMPLAEAWGLKIPKPEAPKSPEYTQVLKLVSQKQSLLKLAWLSATGHLRPGIAKGLPLDEATAKARALDEDLRRLAILSASK